MSPALLEVRRALGDSGMESMRTCLAERVEKLRDDLEKADAGSSADVARIQGSIAALRDLAADLRGDKSARAQKPGGYF